MRNIVILRDQLHALIGDNAGSQLVSLSFDKASSKVFALAQDGSLYCFSDIDDTLVPAFKAHAYRNEFDSADTKIDNQWFEVTFVAGTGCVVMISHSGAIASLEQLNEDEGGANGANYPLVAEEIGCIEGGIATSAWSPDQSSLTIVTNNNTMLCMSSTWDVLQEIPITERTETDSPASISWRGDGEGLAVNTIDKEDQVGRVRMYNQQLELVSTARNIADGAASIMRGIGQVVSYATNGSYIAVVQQQKGAGNSTTSTSSSTSPVRTNAPQKLQVALIERNGLRHGDFDLVLPSVPAGYDRWQEVSLNWDLPTTLIAVGLRAVRDGETTVHLSVADGRPGLLQLYYRANYHWYVKQQWVGEDLTFLGFDEEQVNKMYLSQTLPLSVTAHRTPLLRVVEFTWDIASALSPDATVAVVDGTKLLLTPLGINNIPPPMCKHTVSITAHNDAAAGLAAHCTRAAAFWQPTYTTTADTTTADTTTAYTTTGDTTQVWGYVALSDNTQSLVVLHGDRTGAVLHQQQLSIAAPLEQLGLTATQAVLRGIVATQQDHTVYVTLLGSRIVPLLVPASLGPCDQATDMPDETEFLLVVELTWDVDTNTYVLGASHEVSLPEGSATRLCTVPHDSLSIAVGVQRVGGADFEIHRLDLSDPAGGVRLIATLPELCTHLSLITSGDASADDSETAESATNEVYRVNGRSYAVMALSLRNRLYCGESLLASGVSSFVYNESFAVLMYATLGTRPHMHFCSLQRLLALDPNQHGEDQETAECAEPRPIERGARLVISAEGASRVVMQLPRGNLETIEPRPLILLRAQHLLHENKLLDCLVLLRKQRVDLNYLVDYSPRIFMDNVSVFVNEMLTTSHDLISLLVTALEPVDVTQFKYPLWHIPAQFRAEREVAEFVGDGKVNKVCSTVRNVLLPLLYKARSASVVDDVYTSKILQPVLCTFARQRPAQLVDALDLIRFCCTTNGAIQVTLPADGDNSSAPSAVVTGGNINLSSSLAQVSIKYLAFLAEGSQLFDAALGTCDFDMARAVARQCQMDPKQYLPLIEGFEALGRGFESSSSQFAIMHFKVNHHLKRNTEVVDWAVALLKVYLNSTSADSELHSDVIVVIRELRRVIRAEDLYTNSIPKFAALSLATISSTHRALLTTLLSELRLEYGQQCASRMQYAEAIASILATQPVCALEAVEVAKQMGNWQLALSIAGRYEHEERYAGNSEMSPTTIAQQIVSEFRENMEQSELGGLSGGFEAAEGSGEGAGGGGDAEAGADAAADKVLEAARLCLDYCSDPEGAISILAAAQRWLPALQLSMRHTRRDLFSEIATSARAAAMELMEELPRKARKVSALVAELAVLWEKPEERLKNVASTDITLMDELNGVDSANQRQMDDTASEYSAATQQSTFSRASNMSGRSDSSRYSTKSGTSVVSVLSNLSLASGLSSADGANGRDKQSSFAIEGLEHTLLSKGTVTAKSEFGGEAGAGKDGKRSKKQYRRDQTERRQKRIERSKAKGASKDVWGLRREGAVCDELVGYARQLVQITKACRELCEALLLVSEAGDLALCVELQRACDTYMRSVQQNPPCVAPNYPREWLVKRLLKGVLHFQDPLSLAAAGANQTAAVMDEDAPQVGAGALGRAIAGVAPVAVVSVTTWWDIAAAGLRGWYASSRVTFTVAA